MDYPKKYFTVANGYLWWASSPAANKQIMSCDDCLMPLSFVEEKENSFVCECPNCKRKIIFKFF